MSINRWVVGSNMPGYMPDDAPHLADDYDHAIQCMIGDLENDLDDVAEGEPDDREESTSLEAEYEQIISSLSIHIDNVRRGFEDPEEQGITIGNRHYFVAIAVD